MKTILILRSKSGAGKSFFAEKIKSLNKEGVEICCADDFYMVGGEYKFDIKNLGKGHKWCQEKFDFALINDKIQMIIVANTNTKHDDWRYYENRAKELGFPVIFLVVENRHGGKDSHNVPDFVLDRQEQNVKLSLCL